VSLSRDSKDERIWKLVRRTQFRLKQGIERIQWEEDELIPEIEAMKSGKAVAGLPAGSAIEIVIEHADHRQSEDKDRSESA
jgi:hypothetical protein